MSPCGEVNFMSVFTALNNIKKQRKFNITPYGKNLEGYIFEKFFTT